MGLVCEETANYLIIWRIDLEIEEVEFFIINRKEKDAF
jgi:hypothetical protein